MYLDLHCFLYVSFLVFLLLFHVFQRQILDFLFILGFLFRLVLTFLCVEEKEKIKIITIYIPFNLRLHQSCSLYTAFIPTFN